MSGDSRVVAVVVEVEWAAAGPVPKKARKDRLCGWGDVLCGVATGCGSDGSGTRTVSMGRPGCERVNVCVCE